MNNYFVCWEADSNRGKELGNVHFDNFRDKISFSLLDKFKAMITEDFATKGIQLSRVAITFIMKMEA